MTNKFLACIAEGLADPNATEEEQAALREAQDTYDEAFAAASETLGPMEADRAAAQAVMTELQVKQLRARQHRQMSVRARRDILKGIAAYKTSRGYQNVRHLGGGGGKPPKDGWVQGGQPPENGRGSRGAVMARALELLVENMPGLAGAPFPSIDGRFRAVVGQFHAMMADVVEKFETRTGMDQPGRASLENMVREAFGEDTGDAAAKGLAAAWKETAERARQMFNAAGGDIAYRADWGMPQQHDPMAIRAVGKAQWVEDTLPMLARERMIDRVTKLPFTERRLRAVLGETYDSIASGGANKREPGAGLGRGMLANQRGEERFLTFKDATAWLTYQGKYGAGDAYGVMMGHLDEMARDIAQMQILGPNPAHQLKWLKDAALREASLEEAAGIKGARDRATVHLRQAQNMFDHFEGAANVPEREWLAKLGASARAYLTGVQLGSAILSDVPSGPVFSAYARTFSGLPLVGHMDALVAHMFSPEARAQARRSGFIIETATDGLIKGAQEGLRLQTVGSKVDGQGMNVLARRLPSTIFRVSGLSHATQVRKRTFRLEFMGALADRADKTIADLAGGDSEDQAFAQLLTARGFTEDDWAKIRSAEQWSPKAGANFIRPAEIIAVDDKLGFRVAEMIELQTRQAVPETTLWTRAKLLGSDKPGTFKGEFNRSWAMFRSFTLTATNLFMEDALLRKAPGHMGSAGFAAHAAVFMGMLTIAGGISIQLREAAKGNNPRDMTSAKFWEAAMMQGGGFGIVGDFLYSAQARNGKSSAMTGWGPLAAFGSDVTDATIGNVSEIAGELDAHPERGLEGALERARPGRDGVNLLRKYAPVSSLWWTRAAWDRAVMDQLQKIIDPEAEAAFRRRARSLEKDFGQTQWWEQGQALPANAPDLTTAVPAP